MAIAIIIGLQWGDEGKGKLVDALASAGRYEVVARFQGGSNAGHTVYHKDKCCVLHQIPSGIFCAGVDNLLGNGVVIDPIVFMEEVDMLRGLGINIEKRVFLSRGAHLITPAHIYADETEEKKLGATAIGTTQRGIGPCYQDKVGRRGLRVCDTLRKDFWDKYAVLQQRYQHRSTASMARRFREGVACLRAFPMVDSGDFIRSCAREGKKVLAEGAQGVLLDVDHGTYPYVTATSTCSGHAFAGLGIAPHRPEEICGISKIYCTRVGGGPFPSEVFDDEQKQLQAAGEEFGATTARPRRCGWLDLPALRYAIEINGVSTLFLTKVDVLSGFEQIQLCVGYNTQAGQTETFSPYEDFASVRPIFKRFHGWTIAPDALYNNFAQLPKSLAAVIDFVSQWLHTDIAGISYGPRRQQTLFARPT